MDRSAAIFRFGPYELRLRTRQLYKHGVRIRLRPQPLRVLQVLLENAGDPVSREEFRRQLWPSDTFVDFDHGLNTSVKELRAVLSDSPDKPRYIETLPKLGYRFLADVRQVPANEAATEKAQDERQPSSVSTRPRWPASRRWVVAASITAILAAGLTLYLRTTRFRPKSLPHGGRVMLAVLPFDNLTGDVGQDYFGDGLTEEMITQLGRLNPQRLGVIARTSVMHYKHSQESIGQIGRELGVEYVLEGSVRRDSDQMRITAQLIQVNDQTHLWARQYNRELKDLLLVQGEIAREVSDEIQIAFDDHKPATLMAQPSVSPRALEAHNLYLQGLYFWNKRTVEGFKKGIDYFQRAIDKDANSARAYAGLADSYILLEEYSFPQPELIQKGRIAALRALEIDPNLSEAHTALALIVENFDWDWETAEKEYRRAIELDPNYATAHHWYAEYLMWLGRFDEALHESELARQLDPLSLIIAVDRAEIFYFSKQYDRAIEEFRYVSAMDPKFPHTRLIVLAYLQKGMLAEAKGLLPQKEPIDDPTYWATVADLYYRSGQQERARRALDKLQKWSRSWPLDPKFIVTAYLAVGDKDKALASLEKAYAQHSNLMVYLKVDPMFDPLRSNPRFQKLLHGVGLDR